MSRSRRFPGYAEMRINADRVRTVHLALHLALLDAVLAPCRELLRQRHPLSGEDRRALNPIAKGQGLKRPPSFRGKGLLEDERS